MAYLIYGLYNQHAPQELLNYATAAAFGSYKSMKFDRTRYFYDLKNEGREIN